MSNPKVITFNLCDYDDLHLTFTTGMGVALFSISFIRAFASERHRKAGKENEQTAQELRFTHFNRAACIESASFEIKFRAKDVPRTSEAKTHSQTFELNRPHEINIEGADGADLGRFKWERPGEQVQFNVFRHNDGSGHALTWFPPDIEFRPRRRKGVQA